ncbi:Glucosamine-phosphate N-acetyltransferase-like protein [Gryganskiella cystojenkinii]|nr:Glucosamine-phosphate N-acetyltransferase-like protein [Gryganskiella cystojenkinii]
MSPQQPPMALFSSSLISTVVQNQLPEGYLMRPLEITDYHKGFYDCLAGLTVVGNVSAESFERTFEQMLRAESVYYIVVIEDLKQSKVVATGTLIVEQKFLRSCGKSGHIEDIVVHDSQRGKKFGIRLIDQLKHIGYELGCYKLLLTCSEANEPFYQKSGFERKDLNMAQYLTLPSKTATTPSTTTLPLSQQTEQQIIFSSTLPMDRPETTTKYLNVPSSSLYCQSANSSALSLVYASDISTTINTASDSSDSEESSSDRAQDVSDNSHQSSVHGHAAVPIETLRASIESISVK